MTRHKKEEVDVGVTVADLIVDIDEDPVAAAAAAANQLDDVPAPRRRPDCSLPPSFLTFCFKSRLRRLRKLSSEYSY